MTSMHQDMFTHAPDGFVLPHKLSHLSPQTPILVGFSGGADSALLLRLMVIYGQAYGAPIYAAHFHHGIRGEEANRDLTFCTQVAQELGIPLFTKHADIPALSAASGRSLELEARLARYAFFETCMQEHQIPILVTAHHAGDQLETLLLRFLRGSGTRGMGGIHPVRPLGQGLIIRPLLSCTKVDILASCAAMGISFVTDSTNQTDDATRNRLRHHLIPLMQELSLHGDPTGAALRLSFHAREDEDFIMSCVKDTMSLCVKDHTIALDIFKTLHPAVGKRILGEVFASVAVMQKNECDGKHTLSARHLDTLWEFCCHAASGQTLHLPGQMKAVIIQNKLSFTARNTTPNPSPNTPFPLSFGLTDWDNGHIGIDVSMDICPPISPESIIAQARFPTTVLPLSVRRRASGDVILSHGMHKKLKKLLCDKGIPLDMRDRLPLICHGEESTPLWYPTVAYADGFLPPTQDPTIVITIFEQKSPKGINICQPT